MRQWQSRWWRVGIAWVLGVGWLLLAAEPESEFKFPVLRVPKLARPPTMDGTIAAGEWAGAAAVTGMAATGGVGPNTMVPEIQQVVWYVGFDDQWLYLAMHSPHQRGTYPVARCKENDNMGVLFEDHVEIQLCPYSRAEASRPGKGFFKMMVNPKGFMIDQHLFNGTTGTEELWSTGGPAKCTVSEDAWDLELAIEVVRLKVDKLDGRSLIVQLVRTDWCAGIYFAGLVPAPWLNWNDFARFDFDAASPVLQFRRVGEAMEGRLDTLVTLTAAGAPAEGEAEVLIEDAKGKALHRDKQSFAVKPAETRELTLRADKLAVLPETDGRNRYELKVTYRSPKGTQVLYHNRLPFMRMDEAYRKKYLEPWLAGRPQSGEWEYRIAYLPYSNKADVGVDLDFFGVPPAVQAADGFRVDVCRTGETKPLASGGAAVSQLGGGALLDLPELADGEYEARFILTGDNGAKNLAEKVAAFARRHWPFERNRLGVNDEVIPPWTPIGVKDASLSFWNRTYALAGGGLPAQIVSGPPTGTAGGLQNLLAAPVRLELVSAGQPVAPAEATVKVANAAGHRVEVEGSQKLGTLAATVQAAAEYDGWYEVTLAVRPLPPEPRVQVDSLDLVFDLANTPVDTLYVQRMGDGRYGNRFGAVPATPGVHFQSTSLLKYGDWRSFVPQTYVGNGDRGLWFFAWSRTGWELSEDQPMLTVERLKDGSVRVRVRLLAGPVVIEQPRTLRFALQAAPVKPNDSRYRTRLNEGFVAHDTRGYRLYGDAVDSYALHRDDDYTALRRFLLYGPRYQVPGQGTEYGWWVGHYVHEIQEGARICMYGSTWMSGAAAAEHKTFGGEWFGKSNWKPSPDAEYTNKWNYQGTVQWRTPEELMPTGNNWTQSQTDFFLWYHKPLLEKAGFNGTWWDNSSIGVIREFDPDLGRLDGKWNLYARRQLCKRLNHLGWELMRPPCWAMNMHVDMSFCQIFWMVENDWYADAVDMTALQQWTLDEFRAMARTKSTTLVTKPWLSNFSGSTPELDRKIQRSLVGLLLAHDIVPPVVWNSPPFYRDLYRRLLYAADLADTGRCLFTGYWTDGDTVAPPSATIKVSTYGNAATRSAVLVFLNPDRQDQYLGGTTFDVNRLIDPRARLTPKRVYDLETGTPVATLFENGRFRIVDPFKVDWHEPRFLAIEAE